MRLALAVMARAPIPGRCKTRLLSAYPAEWVAGLQRAMLEDTLERLEFVPAVVRLVLVAPIPDGDARELVCASVPRGWTLGLQRGVDLGARLESALLSLFASAEAERAVILGSDCPHLPLFDDAANEDVLLGPTDDGGY